MSFGKAQLLIELHAMVEANRYGVTLDEVTGRFECSKRTAQRMLGRLADTFPGISARECDDGRKRWRVERGAGRGELVGLAPEDLAALEAAIAAAERDGSTAEARALKRLKDKVVGLMPAKAWNRIEPDLDALLEAQGFVARPGPRPKTDDAVSAAIAEAIKGFRVLEIDYRSHRDQAHRPRRVMPYGVLTGLRRYLVAEPVDGEDRTVRTYRLDAVAAARVTEEMFERPESFDLQAFANRAFGVYQAAAEYGEVVWRFAPEAAEHARGYLFHPGQTMEDEPDGSLLVRFHAAGHLEMCWHLYTWGDKVEVVAPAALRAMVEGHRRADFPAMP